MFFLLLKGVIIVVDIFLKFILFILLWFNYIYLESLNILCKVFIVGFIFVLWISIYIVVWLLVDWRIGIFFFERVEIIFDVISGIFIMFVLIVDIFV